MKSALITAAICMALGHLTAASQLKPVTIYGIGGDSCGTWIAANKQRRPSEYLSWIEGFVTAAQTYGSKQRVSDINAMAAWVDKYCAEHPLDLIVAGATRLADELSKTR
jgi:hypothetical protein